MFVVLGIESKSQNASEKTWLSNWPVQFSDSSPIHFPHSSLHLGTEAGFGAKHHRGSLVFIICAGTGKKLHIWYSKGFHAHANEDKREVGGQCWQSK